MEGANNGDSSLSKQQTILCVKGCGFFGSPATMNMCSKCFGEHQKPPQPREPMPPTPPASKPSTPVAPSAPEIEIEKKVEVTKVEEKKDEAVKSEKQAGPSSKPKKKIQKNRGRCFSCRKKVGLTGFECKCGYVFCGEHRYSDKHDCDFDYRENAREQLKKANPVIVAEKLEKI